MYNGIGLQTPRGSGTNGYVQTNKFLVRARTSKVAVDGNKGFASDQGIAGISKKPNKDILEHDRKRQVELKLVILEDKLSDQGYTDAEIAEKIQEARRNLETATGASDEDGVIVSDQKMSDTQTHQVAARKEKQMEKLRAAFGITSTDADGEKQERLDDIGVDGDHLDADSEREEGELLHGDERLIHEKHYGDDEKTMNEVVKRKVEDKPKRRGYESSDSESAREQKSDSESDSIHETKRNSKPTKVAKRRTSYDSDESDDSASDSEDSYRGRRKQVGRHTKVPKRHDSGSESDHEKISPDYRTARSKHHLTKNKHDSEDEYHVGASKRGIVSGKEQSVAGSLKNKRIDLDRDDHGRKHDDSYPNFSDRYLNDESDSDLEPKPRMRAPERRQRGRRYDSDEDEYGSDHAGDRVVSHGRWKHDSGGDDFDIDPVPTDRARGADKRSKYESGKMPQKSRGYHRELEKREEMEHSEKSLKREERLQGGRKHERKVEHDNNRKRQGMEEDGHVRRRLEKGVEDDHESRKRYGKEEGELKKREDSKDRRQTLERKEEDPYRSRKHEKREESELGYRRYDGERGDKKKDRREDDEQGGRKRERKVEDVQGVRKRERGDEVEDEQGHRKREKRYGDEQGGRKWEKRDRSEQGGRERERIEEEDVQGGRKRYQRSRNDDKSVDKEEENRRGKRQRHEGKESSKKHGSNDRQTRYEIDRHDDDDRRRR